MLLAYPIRELGIFWAMNLTLRRFLLSECHDFCHLIKTAQSWSNHGKIWIVQGRYLNVFEPRINVRLITLRQAIDTVETHLQSCSKDNLNGRWWLQVFEMQNTLCLLYFQKVHNVNGEYYAYLLKLLCEAIKTKCPVKLSKGVFFHQGKSFFSTAVLHNRGFEVIDYSIVCSTIIKNNNKQTKYFNITSYAVMMTPYVL